MPQLRHLSIPLALILGAGPASAQHHGNGSATATVAPSRPAPQASAGSWTGTPSKWGGSPVVQRHEERSRLSYPNQFVQTNAYIPVAVAAPVAPMQNYSPDAPCPPDPAPVQMQVITTPHEPRQLTTIEVYRLQPRFQKP